MKSSIGTIVGIVLVLFLLISLLGCKEEDDTTVNSNPAATDTTPPTVLSTSPEDASTDILIGSDISVIFSEPMDISTITTSIGNTDCSGSLQVSLDDFSSCVQMNSDPTSDTNKAIFTVNPLDNLGYNTVYKIKVTTTVGDTSGNPLEEEYFQTTGFTTVSDTTTDSPADPYGFLIGSISGNTTESGATSTFTICLKSQPSDYVTIGLSSSDTTEGTVSPSSLVFASVDWNVNQSVTVTGIDDVILDGNQTYSIVFSVSSINDLNYDGFDLSEISLINLDDEISSSTYGSSRFGLDRWSP